MKKALRSILLGVIALSSTMTYAQLSLTTAGSPVTIDFESTVSGVNNGNFNGTGATAAPSVGQIDSDGWEITGLSTGTLNFGGSQTSGDYAKGVSSGGVSGGGMYGFIVATGDTALGFQPTGSDFTPGSITLKGLNNTGGTLDSLQISYTLYINNNEARGNSFNSSFSTDNSSFTSLGLDETSTEVSQGSVMWVAFSKTITIEAALADGDDFYLKWDSDDVSGSGSRDEFAIDNISVTGITAASVGIMATVTIDSNVTCNGFSDGGATASATGGTIPYTYNWSNTATTASITGVVAGTYSVTITDNNGITSTASGVITESTLLVATSVADSNVTCNGLSDAGATAAGTGGTMPYTYTWSNSATTASITGVVAGTYSVTLTDANGCTDSASITLTEPAALMATSVVDSNVSINGGMDGGATASATGGTMPYTYLWSNSATTASITGVVAGTYTVSVIDQNGCGPATSQVSITEPTTILATVVADSNVSCNGFGNGGLTASATGGTMPYTYQWSNANIGASITALIAGTYTVTVTDNNGATTMASGTITEPMPITESFSVTAESCIPGNDGSITVNVTGGTMPYTYLWSTGGTSNTETNLTAGTYTLTLTDGNGCLSTSTTVITGPAPILVSMMVNDVTTVGGSDGSITANVSGGTPAYTYLWSSGGTAATETNLSAGTYTVTVSDANGCSEVETAIVQAPTVIADLVITEINYNGPESGTDTSEFIEFVNAGTTTINLDGYSFGQGVTHTFTANDSILAGQYFVIALDSSGFRNRFGMNADAIWTNGGLSNGGEDITIVDNFGRTVDSVDYDDASPWPFGSAAGEPDGGGASIVLCDSLSDNNDGSNWNAAISPIGGQVINGLQVYANPGTRANCVDPLVATINNDSNVTCFGFSDGGLGASIMGGMAPYTYNWSNTATTVSITGVTAGTYTVTITDALGTTATETGTVTEPAPIVVTTVAINVTTVGGSDGSITANVSGGTPTYNYLWSNGSIMGPTISSLPVGTYSVTVTDMNGCTEATSETVMGPSAVVPSVSSTDVSCNAISDGTATVNATGGTMPYTYNWVGGLSTATISALSAGTYTVTITDGVGTTAIDSAIINEPTAITTSFITADASAAGVADGSIDLTVSGGTPGYTYNWNTTPPQTTKDITNLLAGTYCVTVTDANGCTATDCAVVNEPGPLAELIITEINYNGPESGTDTSEFIEFVNAGMSTINLDGYSFGQGVVHTFTANDSITAGQYYVIAFDSSAFRNRFGINADAIWTSGGLTNGGEDITIVDNFGRTVDSVDYDDASPWPFGSAAGEPDGGGASIELIDSLLDNNDGVNWAATSDPVVGQIINGLQVFGTPGRGAIAIGISENPIEETILHVYPNPTKGLLTIELDANFNDQLRLQLISLEGKVLRDELVNQSKLNLDLRALSNGIYFLKLGEETQKIILNR